jgi:hypothetical protein
MKLVDQLQLEQAYQFVALSEEYPDVEFEGYLVDAQGKSHKINK